MTSGQPAMFRSGENVELVIELGRARLFEQQSEHDLPKCEQLMFQNYIY